MRRALVLGLLLIAAGGWILGWSPYVRVETIAVEGATSLSRSDVIRASGITIGQPLARITGARVERGLTSLPRVESVKIVRSWPHGVTLRIKERTAIAMAGNRGVDQDGVLFTLAPGEKVPNLRISPSNPSSANIKIWLSIYNKLPIKADVREVDLSDMEAITFKTEKTTVVWGSSEQTPTKIDVLKKLDPSKFSAVDLSAPLAPTTKK